MCLYPKIIKNRKYISNKKNGGNIPAISDIRVTMVPVGCGKCMECMKKKKREWQVRLTEEIKTNRNGKFVTLTFSDESIKELSKEIKLDGYERDNEICTKAMRLFLERWRKKYKKSVRHWFITELGHKGTENVHMHGIIFTDNEKEIEKIWKYGFVWIGDYVGEKTINYIIKYVTKTDVINTEYKPKILTSSGIGKGYIKKNNTDNNKYKKGETNETYRNNKGYKIALPIYYRNKIYTEEEKEKLWIEKLDNEKRYVDGIAVDVSKDEKAYENILEKAREKNKRLGYGNDKINWEKKRYENERRNINYMKRINREKVGKITKIEPTEEIGKENIKGGEWNEAF